MMLKDKLNYENIRHNLMKKGYIYVEEYKGIDIYFYISDIYILYAIYDKDINKFIEQDIISKLSCKQKITKYLRNKLHNTVF